MYSVIGRIVSSLSALLAENGFERTVVFLCSSNNSKSMVTNVSHEP